MISYDEFLERSTFSQVELLAFAHATLIDDPPEGFECRLPTPPMLMFDRVVELNKARRGGRIVAERKVHIDDWFFQCHFKGDPVQPGCLGVDAIWQLLGFYCATSGAIGSGRALGCKEVSFEGQIRPDDCLVRYEVDVRRYTEMANAGAAIVIGNGRVLVDGTDIYTIADAKVGVFRDIAYTNYPSPGPRARGGLTLASEDDRAAN
jgi:3-hydroxyacyl-[acyl-carrier protein] dehydratase/trans-2-decenoyl-[acyl-carrier protein] isomerase